MPTRWLIEIVAASTDAREIFETAEIANVSASAAMLSINRLLSRGHIVVLMKDKVAEMVLASPGTNAKLPEQGERLDARVITPLAGDSGTLTFGGRRINWWSFNETAAIAADADERNSNGVLAEILMTCSWVTSHRGRTPCQASTAWPDGLRAASTLPRALRRWRGACAVASPADPSTPT